MKLGILADVLKDENGFSIKELDLIKECGYDYLEIKLSQLTALSDAEFNEFLEFYKTVDLPAPVCAYFFPGNMRIIGNLYDEKEFKDYAEMAVARANKFGVKTLVVGSGIARSAPFGMDKNEGKAQFTKCLKYILEQCKKYDIILCLEHLNRLESNMITSFREGCELCREINSDHLKMILDFYHFNIGNEDFALINQYKDLIVHTHYATPLGRSMPDPLEIDEVMETLDFVKIFGYNELMTMECRQTEFPTKTKEYKDIITLIKERY